MPELLRMPEIAANATEAVLSSWSVAENARVRARDVVATVETDKAVVDVEAEADGVDPHGCWSSRAPRSRSAPRSRARRARGRRWTTSTRCSRDLGVDATPGDAGDGRAGRAPGRRGRGRGAGGGDPRAVAGGRRRRPARPSVGRRSAERSATASARSTATVTGTDGRVFASPLARRLAKDAGLAVEQIAGTGPGGRIVRRDVERAQAERRRGCRRRQPAAGRRDRPRGGRARRRPGTRDVPHSQLRRPIARAAHREQARPRRTSTCAPPCRSTGCSRCAPSSTTAPRSRVSVNDLVVKAVAAGAPSRCRR